MALAMVVAAGVAALWPEPAPTSRVTRLNFGLLDEGMTKAEAERVLGPPTDEGSFPAEEQLLATYSGPGQRQIWQNDTGRITIYFHRDRVVYKRFGVVGELINCTSTTFSGSAASVAPLNPGLGLVRVSRTISQFGSISCAICTTAAMSKIGPS
jgi:hypothetical protein